MSSLLYKDAVQLNENIEILLGLPSKIKTGVQTEINHVVICTYGSGQEIINNDSDTIIIEDEQGRDVSDYYWWARPGKYTITVATFAICPAMGPEKAPTEIIATSSPQFPVSNLKSYDFDFLKAQLETNGPSSLTRKDITFDFRSSPFNAGLTNLRLTENNTVSSFSAVPKLEAGSSPSSIKSVYLGVNAAPQGLSRLGTPNAILGLTRTLELNASSAPSSLKAWDDATDDPRSVEVFNLNFLDQPDALPTSVELINLKLRVGPESLTSIGQPQVGPESLITTVSPVVGPTELLAYYKLFGYNAPTDIEVGEISPSVASKPSSLTIKTSPTSSQNPSGIHVEALDKDEDTFWDYEDNDDNDNTIGAGDFRGQTFQGGIMVPVNWSVMESDESYAIVDLLDWYGGDIGQVASFQLVSWDRTINPIYGSHSQYGMPSNGGLSLSGRSKIRKYYVGSSDYYHFTYLDSPTNLQFDVRVHYIDDTPPEDTKFTVKFYYKEGQVTGAGQHVQSGIDGYVYGNQADNIYSSPVTSYRDNSVTPGWDKPQRPRNLTAKENIVAAPTDLTFEVMPLSSSQSFSPTGLSTWIIPDQGDMLTYTLATNMVGQISSSNVNLQMLWAPSGTFTMGSPTTEADRETEFGGDETQHQVTLTDGFYLGRFEVTQAQYQAVMAGNTNSLSANPSTGNTYSHSPVETVSWNDVQIFLSRLNAQQSANIPAGWSFVLPTEAQWEYACRAGTTTAYSWGNTIATSDAKYSANGPASVAYYLPNDWGYFDMHGNVWELVQDRYTYPGTYPTGAQTDPTGPASGTSRALRGGSWINLSTLLRSAYRSSANASRRYKTFGFRVALVKS